MFPLQLDDLSDLAYTSGHSGASLVSAARRRMLEAPAVVGARNTDAPAFFRRGRHGMCGLVAAMHCIVCLCVLAVACSSLQSPPCKLVLLTQSTSQFTSVPRGSFHPDVSMLCRGTFEVDAAGTVRGPSGHLADTYLALHGWSKGESAHCGR